MPDIAGPNRVPQYLGRERALDTLMREAPGRVAAYGIENHAGTPVYVHAKLCVVDDVWASTGSDNFNRRSWTTTPLSPAVVLDHDYALDLRLTLAAEHLDRLGDVASGGLREVMADCLEPAGLYDAYAASADRLEAWHRGGRVGERPPGRLRPIPLPELSRAGEASWRRLPLEVVHDPDGRPGPLRGERGSTDATPHARPRRREVRACELDHRTGPEHYGDLTQVGDTIAVMDAIHLRQVLLVGLSDSARFALLAQPFARGRHLARLVGAEVLVLGRAGHRPQARYPVVVNNAIADSPTASLGVRLPTPGPSGRGSSRAGWRRTR